MRYCVANDDVIFDEATQFAVYTVEKDAKRSYILQYVRNEGEPEVYERFGIVDSAATGAGEREFTSSKSLLNLDDVNTILSDKEVRYKISLVSKDKLDTVLLNLNISHALRASSIRQAFQSLTDRIKPLLGGVEINPLELALGALKIAGTKKIEGRAHSKDDGQTSSKGMCLVM